MSGLERVKLAGHGVRSITDGSASNSDVRTRRNDPPSDRKRGHPILDSRGYPARFRPNGRSFGKPNRPTSWRSSRAFRQYTGCSSKCLPFSIYRAKSVRFWRFPATTTPASRVGRRNATGQLGACGRPSNQCCGQAGKQRNVDLRTQSFRVVSKRVRSTE
jgi:hypothetical protein